MIEEARRDDAARALTDAAEKDPSPGAGGAGPGAGRGLQREEAHLFGGLLPERLRSVDLSIFL